MTPQVAFEISEARTPEELQECFHLRWERLRKDHGLPHGSEKTDDEDRSIHVVAKVDGRVVAAGCLFIEDRLVKGLVPRRYGYLRQLAVLDEYEGYGIGTAMMEEMERLAWDAGAQKIIGYRRGSMARIMDRLGWAVDDDTFVRFGDVEHTPVAKWRPGGLNRLRGRG